MNPAGNPTAKAFEGRALHRGNVPDRIQGWNNDHTVIDFRGKSLIRDYDTMGDVHHGMKSGGFAGAHTEPRQAVARSKFHRARHDFIAGKAN